MAVVPELLTQVRTVETSETAESVVMLVPITSSAAVEKVTALAAEMAVSPVAAAFQVVVVDVPLVEDVPATAATAAFLVAEMVAASSEEAAVAAYSAASSAAAAVYLAAAKGSFSKYSRAYSQDLF